MDEKFDKWDKRFIDMAQLVSTWSSCFQTNRQVGAVIVKNKRVMTTGYNGAASGIKSCKERGSCLRRELNIPSGTRHEIPRGQRYELCRSVHAEQNAIIQAAKLGVCIDGATLYCTHQPCVICAKMIINSGIKRIVYKDGYPDEFSMQLLRESGVEIVKFEE